MKLIQAPLECYSEPDKIEESLAEMWQQLRKHALEENILVGGRKHFRIIVMVSERKAKELFS